MKKRKNCRGGRGLLSDFFNKIGQIADRVTGKLYSLDGKVGRTLHINESYTAKALTLLYFMPDFNPGISARTLENLLMMMLCLTMALFTVIPGYILFAFVIIMYFLFIAKYTWSVKKCAFSSFDVLLVLFCFVVLSVASVGKDIGDVLSIYVVYGSFIILYFVIVNTADNERKLYKLKFIFCMVGAFMAAVQLTENILSYEMKVLGQIYVLSAPMDFELFFMTKNKKIKILLMVAATLTLIALTVCWSGGSWVWATFILAFFIVIKDWRLLLVGGIGLLFVPFILPGEIIDFHKLAKTGIMDYLFAPSADYRISAYGALAGILDYYRDYPSTGKWHASLIIFVCIIILLLLILREIFFGLKSGQMGMVLAVLSAVGFGVTGFLYSDITTGIWSHYKTLFVFWLYTSLYAADARLNKNERESLSVNAPARFCFIDTIPLLICLAYLLAAI